jgi:hypothetical protein
MLVWPESDWKATIVSAAITKKETGEWPSYIEPGYEVGILTNYGEVKLKLISVDEEADGALIFQQKQAFVDANGNVIKNGLLDNRVQITEPFSISSYAIPKAYVVAGSMSLAANEGYKWRINTAAYPWQCEYRYNVWDLSYSELNGGASYSLTGDFTFMTKNSDKENVLIKESATVDWDCSFQDIMDTVTDFKPIRKGYKYMSTAANRVCYDEKGKPVTYALRSYNHLDYDLDTLTGALSYVMTAHTPGRQVEAYEAMAGTDAVFYGVSAGGVVTNIKASERPYRFPCIAFKV